MPNPRESRALKLTSGDIGIDPTAPGTIIRHAIGIETSLNVIRATVMLTCTSRILSYIIWELSANNAALAALFQWLGSLIYGLAVLLLCALPNTRGDWWGGFRSTTPLASVCSLRQEQG